MRWKTTAPTPTRHLLVDAPLGAETGGDACIRPSSALRNNYAARNARARAVNTHFCRGGWRFSPPTLTTTSAHYNARRVLPTRTFTMPLPPAFYPNAPTRSPTTRHTVLLFPHTPLPRVRIRPHHTALTGVGGQNVCDIHFPFVAARHSVKRLKNGVAVPDVWFFAVLQLPACWLNADVIGGGRR